MSSRRKVALGAAGIALAAVAFVIGYAVHMPSGVRIEHGSGISAAGAISLRGGDGWVYDVPLDVAWTDQTGSFHSNGRPDCLPPTGRQVGPITFGEEPVNVAGAQWRQVVWVSCQ
ncbi:MAG TPA: hypothetical protein VF137_11320 [Candidatus Dormibacteraeota bacterium]